jgi:hypothetical protein
VLFSNSSPSYVNLTQVGDGGGDDDGGLGGVEIGALVALALVLAGILAFVLQRRRTVEERE